MKANHLFKSLLLLTLISCGSKETISGIESTNIPNIEQTTELENEGPTENCVNLISNGSFEEGHNLETNKWDVFTELGAWKVDLSASDAPIEIQNGENIGGLPASHGSAKLELDSHNKNGFSESDVVLYQDVEIIQGSDYILEFDYSPRVRNDESTNFVEVYFDGNLIATLNSEVVKWQTYSLVVTGSSISKLEFFTRADSDTLGGYLDNVKLKPIACN